MENMNNETVKRVVINPECMGFAELKDNCWNYTIISTNASKSACDNEYYAGYVQGKLQGAEMLKASRNNTWDNAFLCNTEHSFPTQIGPTKEELWRAAAVLKENHDYLDNWIHTTCDQEIAQKITRLRYRMYGIFKGATGAPLETESELQEMFEEEIIRVSFTLGYGDNDLSFGDIYFINAQMDLFDVVSNSPEAAYGLHKSDHCSAFLKRVNGDVFWTHNSWCGYLSQSHTLTYLIRNGDYPWDDRRSFDFITQNSYCPGQFGSNMDFGFNGNGICFNETTHRYSHNKPKADGVWLCWRAAAAEMFAKSIDDFYRYITVDNTGTYLNGYMLIDTNKSNEFALIEMSYKRFVMFRSDGKQLTVTDSTGVKNPEYDHDLITPEYIFGVNYPISKDVAEDLKSTDNRPMRRVQFKEQISTVNDMESAKALITYVGKDSQDKEEPLSIYGRWDLGRGTTKYPKTIPDGAVDAKAYSAFQVMRLLNSLKFEPNENSSKCSFWMLYGTAKMEGKPFVWSESAWKNCKLDSKVDFVPDKLEGAWNETKLFID